MEISNNLLSQTVYKSLNKYIALPKTEEETTEETNVTTPEPVINTESTDVSLTNGITQEARYTDIKAAIYNYCHPKQLNQITQSYGSNFDEVCAKLNLGPNSVIQKSYLTKLTLNDTNEDSNNDFYGALNRAFSYLGPNDTISYKDLMLFCMRGAGNDGVMTFNEYKTVVNTYANITEQNYRACSSDQAKLNFIIQKTEQYLDESGMVLQKAALNRLLNASSTNTGAHVGQIAFEDLGGKDANGFITLGGYTTTYTLKGDPQTHTRNGKTYDITFWAADIDDGNNDGGITLNSRMLSGSYPWYHLVETLVHELTHATAYYYYDVDIDYTKMVFNRIGYSSSGIQFMIDKGIIQSGQYSLSDISNSELQYLVDTMWGEYSAYITSANYYDSIAGDIFDNTDHDLCVNGSAEKNAIYNHIEVGGYNKDKYGNPLYEAEPFEGKWDIYNTMFYA